jgi:hypothetical protein
MVDIRVRKPPFGRETRVVKNLTPRRAIRLLCYECVGWQRGEVALCRDELCPLWTYRQKPKNPTGGEGFEDSGDFDDPDDPDYTEVHNG